MEVKSGHFLGFEKWKESEGKTDVTWKKWEVKGECTLCGLKGSKDEELVCHFTPC